MTRYTADDLVREARAAGLDPVSRRLVSDWIELGLLDARDAPGLGRGRGRAAGTWSDEQRQLFLLLLAKRGEVKHMADLCNVVVWFWLYCGDKHVPLRQVRRALQTWGKVASGAGWARGRELAKRLLGRWGHPDAGAKDRKAAVDAVSRSLYKGEMNQEEMLSAIQRVLDPHGTGEGRGPAGAQINAQIYMSLVWSRAEVLRQLDTIDDFTFEWARFANLLGVQAYLGNYDNLAADTEFGREFPPVDFSHLVNGACEALVTTLGRPLLWEPHEPDADPRLINPATWRQHRLHMDVHAVQTAEGLDMNLEVHPLPE
jgi:hypothetical protein